MWYLYNNILQKTDSKTQKTSFACLEIHVVPESEDNQAPRYRVFSHTGTLEGKQVRTKNMLAVLATWLSISLHSAKREILIDIN